MQILLKRSPSLAHCTLGDLYIDGVWECKTLEDVVREIPGKPVTEWKVPNETAIPSGTYAVFINDSPHFGRPLPMLLNVPGFTGVRIHPGNTAKDTEGCILVGKSVAGESIVESRVAFGELFAKIQDAIDSLDKVHITVENA